MDAIVKQILSYLSDKTKSLTRKIIGTLLIILVVLGVDNCCGFSYYFISNQKIEHIRKIEETKSYCKNNPKLLDYINGIELEALNRKNVFQLFGDLFDRVNIDTYKKDNLQSDTQPLESNGINHFFKSLFPEYPNRSQLWHTLTSSALPIASLVFISILLLLILPFIKMDDKLAAFLGAIILWLILAGMTWFFQWLWGLLPIILNRAYINYTLQILVQILFCIWLWKISKKTKENQVTK